jgi:hypothetical protein
MISRDDQMETIICKKCGIEKELSSEFFHKKRKSFRRECKECVKIYGKNYRKINVVKEKLREKKYRENHKEEIRQKHAEYRKNNKEKISVHYRLFYTINKTKILSACQAYRDKNKDKAREYHKNYNIKNKQLLNNRYNKKIRSNPAFRLRKYVSGYIRNFLKSNNKSKKGSVLNYLPYSIEELKKHIENQFEFWMNWDNRGIYSSKNWDDNDPTTWKWQLDHIIPHSDLPYDSMDHENFQKCWALKNLRPLSAKQNYLDGVRRIRHKKKSNFPFRTAPSIFSTVRVSVAIYSSSKSSCLSSLMFL